MSFKQDRITTRTSEDLRRRLNVKGLDEAAEKVDSSIKDINDLAKRVDGISETVDNTRNNYVSTQSQLFTDDQKERARNNIGAGTSSFSGAYNNLQGKPTSLNDINVNEYEKLNEIEDGAEKNVIETIKVNGVAQEVINKEVNILPTNSYNLSQYKVESLTINYVDCIEKDKRVCINFMGVKDISANTETILFNFPTALKPTTEKNFIVYGENTNNSYIGYGTLNKTGEVKVKFNEEITSYIRFNFVYDL